MNLFVFMGRLTRDPEIRYTSTNMAIANFSLAVDRWAKKDEKTEADFIPCTAFDKKAEFVEKYLVKGSKVVVSGRVQNNNYTNKEGQKVYGFQFLVDSIEFAESKKAAQAPAAQPDPGDFVNIPEGVTDAELPFV